MNREKNKALLRLFNGIEVEDQTNKTNPHALSEMLGNGYILADAIRPTREVLDLVNSVVGMSGEKANSSFHKSWSVVKDTPMEILVIQQIIHYITTYGFEALGVYDENTVYIPSEALDIPEVSLERINLTLIKALTRYEILESIAVLASSGMALSPETIEDIMTIVSHSRYESAFSYSVQNRELKAKLFEFYGLVPNEPVEFLRYVINKLTGESLIIKNTFMIDYIKSSDGDLLDELMEKAPDNLASIFLRYKVLFLAMKSISGDKGFYNRLRKQADKMHVPLGEDYLNSVTGHIKNGTLKLTELAQKLESASIFRKIRLAYALQYRLNPADSIVYLVRNGRGWVADFEWDADKSGRTSVALSIVLKSIAGDLGNKVNGVKVLLPENINYALPATEKQFSGNYPTGSYISVPEDDLIVGIYWEDNGQRVDLDLSLLNMSGKIGWDSSYRNKNRTVMFSGDLTSAPNGASELYYYENGVEEPGMLDVNYYNFRAEHPVDCQVIIASKKDDDSFNKNYMVNPNNIISTHTVKIDEKQTTLGIVMKVEDEVRFYLSGASVGSGITSKLDGITQKSIDFYEKKFMNTIDMGTVLEMAGAEIVHSIDDVGEDEEFIDLVNIDKTTFIRLLS